MSADDDLWMLPDRDKLREIIAAAIREAVAEEREACVKATCIYCAKGLGFPDNESSTDKTLRHVTDQEYPAPNRPICYASAIRARGSK